MLGLTLVLVALGGYALLFVSIRCTHYFWHRVDSENGGTVNVAGSSTAGNDYVLTFITFLMAIDVASFFGVVVALKQLDIMGAIIGTVLAVVTYRKARCFWPAPSGSADAAEMVDDITTFWPEQTDL